MKSQVATAQTISEDSIVTVARDLVSSELADEIVILNLESGTYYGIDGIGIFIWSLIQKPIQVSKVQQAILHEFDVDPERCQQELMELLDHLAEKDLVVVRN